MQPLVISRRSALQWLVALGAFAGPIGVASSSSGSSLLRDLDLGAICDLGREYVSAHPEDSGVRAVASLLGVDSDAPERVEAVRDLMQRDFAADRLVHLSGWFISVTEARVFAALSRCGS